MMSVKNDGGGSGPTPKEEIKLKLICQHCSRPFGETDLLNRHIANVHAVEKRFKCKICGKGFGVNGNLNAHMRKVHSKNLKLPCEICGKILSDEKTLQNHVMVSFEFTFMIHGD